MIFLGLLAGLLTLLLAGGGVALLVLRGRARVNALELAALSWFFGTGAISLLLWLGGLLFSGAWLQGSVTAMALLLGGLGLAGARRDQIFFPRPIGAVEWLLAAALAAQCLVLAFYSFRSGLGWDGLLNWEIKARYAFLNGGVLPATYWADGARNFTHQSYPLWSPFTELWLYLWMGEAHQFWIKILSPSFYAAGVIMLAVLGTRLTGRRWLGLLVATLFFFIPSLTSSPGNASSGYADVPLGLLYLTAIGLLLLQTNAFDISGWRAYALCLALLPWAKREGLILWVIAAGCGLFVILRAGHPRRALLWLWPGAALALGWSTFCRAMGKVPDQEFMPITLATGQANLERVVPLARAALFELIATTRWSLFWPLVLLAFAVLMWRARDRRILVLFVAVAAPLALYPATYVFSGWGDWLGHEGASLPRLLLHVMPVAWLAIALALRPPGSSATTR